MIGRLLCALGLHVRPSGLNPRWTFEYPCGRGCGKRLFGALAVRRR